MTETTQSREHGKPDREKLHIFVNRRKFDDPAQITPVMTGAEIAGLVGVPASNAVVRLESGPNQREIASDEAVELHNGMHFLVTRRTVEGGYGA